MNYLAHLVFAGAEPEAIAGSLAADSLRGPLNPALPAAFTEAVRIHRAIDAFTDSHPATRASRQRLESEYRHWSRVLVDVFYDHVLATNWDALIAEPFDEFEQRVYEALASQFDLFPPEARGRFEAMTRARWLGAYREIHGIRRSLRGISSRTKSRIDLEPAVSQLESGLDAFSADFAWLFGDLRVSVPKWSDSNL